MGAGSVAEQLGFGMVATEGAATDRDEQTGAFAVAVDLPGEQLLAGAGLAFDQHRLALWREALEFFADPVRAWVEEHQGLGADAQRTAVGVGEGQRRGAWFLAHG